LAGVTIERRATASRTTSVQTSCSIDTLRFDERDVEKVERPIVSR